MRANLGCGANKLEGWLNVDKFATFEPDQRVDLESFPWPWRNDQFEEVMLTHVLEHLGAHPDVHIGVMKELWRVCTNGATVTIAVPDPRHDFFIGDPTHVRPITSLGLSLFSRKANEQAIRDGWSSTPLALYHGVDFEIVSHSLVLDEPWGSDLQNGRIDQAAAHDAARRFNNVVREQTFVLKVVK
jgi:hypothetical protein